MGADQACTAFENLIAVITSSWRRAQVAFSQDGGASFPFAGHDAMNAQKILAPRGFVRVATPEPKLNELNPRPVAVDDP